MDIQKFRESGQWESARLQSHLAATGEIATSEPVCAGCSVNLESWITEGQINGVLLYCAYILPGLEVTLNVDSECQHLVKGTVVWSETYLIYTQKSHQ